MSCPLLLVWVANMLATAFHQLRVAASLALGLRLSPASLEHLADAARATFEEFGDLRPGGVELAGGPALADDELRSVQLRRFQQQVQRAERETAYYAQLFRSLGLEPSRLQWDQLGQIPPTTKAALRADPDAFVRRGSRPVLGALSTGTTGRPTCVAFSADELRIIMALSALAFLTQGQIRPDDIVQISTSSRATLGNLSLAGACARIGAPVYLAGIIEPAETLALLATERRLPSKKSRVSVLSVYPSYLGELIDVGLQLGYRPRDFGLERVLVGGEIVTEGLRARCERLFGAAALVEQYGMSETIPFGAARCPSGHLHFECSRGVLEVVDARTGAPVGPGEVGSLVVTPLPPYRDTTILLRYDTQDVVSTLDERPTCAWRHLPATSDILGKLPLVVRHDQGLTYPRHVLEALEAIVEVPLPARCGYSAVYRGVAVEVLVRNATADTRARIASALEEHGVPLHALRLVEDAGELRQPLPLRCDLRETSLTPTSPILSPVA